MNAAFNEIDIATALTSLVHNRGAVHTSGNGKTFLLISGARHLPITVTVDGDVVRIRAGFDLHVNVGNDVPYDEQSVTEVVEAILGGAAEEYFDVNSRGEMDAVGWRIWYLRGERTGGLRTSEVPPVRLLPW